MMNQPEWTVPNDVLEVSWPEGVTVQCRECGLRWDVTSGTELTCAECEEAHVIVVGGPGVMLSDDPTRRVGGRRYRQTLDDAHVNRCAFLWPPGSRR